MKTSIYLGAGTNAFTFNHFQQETCRHMYLPMAVKSMMYLNKRNNLK